MKKNNHINHKKLITLVAPLCIFLGLSACSTTKAPEVSASPTSTPVTSVAPTTTAAPTAAAVTTPATPVKVAPVPSGTQANVASQAPAPTLNSAPTSNTQTGPDFKDLQSKRIYFEFDSYAVSGDNVATLQAHADAIKSGRARSVAIQGNADERGSKEYNLALGNKRAVSVLNALEALGVKAAGIDVTSFGEENPIDSEQSESAWTKNRRVDFVYSY